MSSARASLKNLWINAFAVVTDAQPKLPLVVSDLHFDSRCLCMMKGIAYRLARNAVDVVSQDWSEIPGCAFYIHAKLGRLRVPLICEFCSEHTDRPREIVRNNRRGTQSLHRIATFGDCLPSLIDDSLQRPLELGTIRELVRHGVKLHQHSLKALQQGVVQFSGDASSFSDTFFHAHLKLACQLPQPQHVQHVQN